MVLIELFTVRRPILVEPCGFWVFGSYKIDYIAALDQAEASVSTPFAYRLNGN
jgi:hypothetical protein